MEKSLIGQIEKEIENKSKSGSYQRGELAKKILIMVAAGIAIPASIMAPNLPLAIKSLCRMLSKKCNTRSENLIKSINSLKKNRLISVVGKGGQQILTLSENGKKRVLQFNLDKLAIKRPKKWDGLWRLIIFDVPEEIKNAREALRAKLKNLGFFQLQKSCFVYPYECKKEIDFITEIFQISPYINFIIAKEIEGQEKLKRNFNL